MRSRLGLAFVLSAWSTDYSARIYVFLNCSCVGIPETKRVRTGVSWLVPAVLCCLFVLEQ